MEGTLKELNTNVSINDVISRIVQWKPIRELLNTRGSQGRAIAQVCYSTSFIIIEAYTGTGQVEAGAQFLSPAWRTRVVNEPLTTHRNLHRTSQ